MTRRLLAVHAHPDDESITMGGTFAYYAAAGVEMTLVTCTLGEEGEVIPAELRGLASDQADQLGGYRHVELTRACTALGVTDHRYLGGIGRHRDSGMIGTPPNDHPRALLRSTDGAGFETAVAELAALIEQVRPQVVLSYDADGGYGHPDHIAASRIARAATARSAARRFYAVVRPDSVVGAALADFVTPSGYAAPVPADLGVRVHDRRVSVRIPVAGFRDQHRTALGAHATQLELLPGGFALSNRIAQPILDAEYFSLLDGEPLPAGVSDDLFAGLD